MIPPLEEESNRSLYFIFDKNQSAPKQTDAKSDELHGQIGQPTG